MNISKDKLEQAVRAVVAQLQGEESLTPAEAPRAELPLPAIDAVAFARPELYKGATILSLRPGLPGATFFSARIRRADGTEGWARVVLKAPSAVSTQASAPIKAPLVKSAAPAQDIHSVDTDTLFRGAANVLWLHARTPDQKDFFANFSRNMSATARADFMRPLLTVAPMPTGDVGDRLHHVKVLLHNAAPRPNVEQLLADLNYEGAWAACAPAERGEWTSFENFRAYHRNCPAVRVAERDAKIASAEDYLATHAEQIGVNTWRAKPTDDTKKREEWFSANVEQTGPNSFRLKR